MYGIPDKIVKGQTEILFNRPHKLYVGYIEQVRAAASAVHRLNDLSYQTQGLGTQRRGIRFGGRIAVPLNFTAIPDLELLPELESEIVELTYARNTLLSRTRVEKHLITSVSTRVDNPYKGGFSLTDYLTWGVETEYVTEESPVITQTLGAFTITVGARTSTSITVSWSAPATPGSISAQVSYSGRATSPLGIPGSMAAQTTTSYTFSDLTPGQSYVIQIVATATGYNSVTARAETSTLSGI